MWSILAAAVLAAAPDVSARPIRTVRCDDGPCLEVRFKSGHTTRLVLGAGAVAAVRRAFPQSGSHAVEALVEAVETASKKRSLRRAALRIAAEVADARAVPLVREEPGVRIEGDTASRLARIAERHFRASGRRLTVTSGTRTPLEQADAMYAKVRYGGSLGIYKDRDVVRALRDAARQARKARLDRDGVVRAMAAVIDAELRRGNPISRHLIKGAVDIRIVGPGAADRRALRAAVAAEPGVSWLLERRPPHVHLSFD